MSKTIAPASIATEGRPASRRAAILAWGLLGLCLVCAGIGVALGATTARAPDADVGPFFAFAFPIGLLAFPVVGALVASRQPRNPLGWLLLFAGLVFAAGGAAQASADHLPAVWGRVYAAWVVHWSIQGSGIFTFFTFFLLLFPNGNLPTRRWRHLARLSIAVTALFLFLLAFQPGVLSESHPPTQNPFPIGAFRPIWNVLQLPLFLTLTACVPAAAVSFVLRFRRSKGAERQQLKWFALAGVIVGVVIVVAPVIFARPSLWYLWPALFLIGTTSVPIAVGIAILRYRLYDIDRIISRTLAYAVVTALLGGTFALLVLVPTTLLGSGTKTPGWLVALGTLVVFGLFRPVLRRVRSVVDRRFNRSRYDATRTIQAFSSRLREEIDIDALEAELRQVVAQTMQPEHVSLWVRGDKP
jgi:hypothetical protein